MRYDPPTDDYKFLFDELFDAYGTISDVGHGQCDKEIIELMLDGFGELARDVWFPTNIDGDLIGAIFEEGNVSLPDSMRSAWKETVDGGWLAIPCSEDHGGGGFPLFLRIACDEMAISGNMALATCGALSLGVYDLISDHAEESLVERFAPHVASGHWASTMCLTEAHAGTDLGIIRTKAIEQEDGTYLISGQKIFISFGEHNLSENIVHMVLAKTPGSPLGTKGISLFLVPKYLTDENGNLQSTTNGVQCNGIEHKMGLHGSPTCVMQFENAKGWLIGELNTGMALMFEMMNRERLGAAMMGVGLGEVAYQNSLDWAKERRQGRDLKGPVDPKEDADNILVHPDVRRMLLISKANNEGCRALGAWIGMLLDEMRLAEGVEKEKAESLVSLLTPVVKAHFTDLGCETVAECMQVLGGAGYIHESGIEQFYRDVRISRIWEGTNGIQALDLCGRKIPANMGKSLRYLMWPMLEFIEENKEDPLMAPYTKKLYQGARGLQQLTLLLMSQGAGNPHFLAAGATDYTRYFANVVIAYLWAQIIKICLPKAEQSEFHATKIATAKIFFDRIYPETMALAAKIQAGHKSLMNYPLEMM